jgi:hypothetical protein
MVGLIHNGCGFYEEAVAVSILNSLFTHFEGVTIALVRIRFGLL